MTAFDTSVAQVLAEETGGDPDGGYTNDPRDPGGETRWGISKRAYPAEDIKNLTRERAIVLYRRDYWDPMNCDRFDPVVAHALFDSAVNSGVRPSTRWIQRAAKVFVDGVMGPKTIAAIQAESNPHRLLMRFYGARLLVLADLATWDTFGRGWTRRVARNLSGA